MSCVVWASKGSSEEPFSDPTRPPIAAEIVVAPDGKDQPSDLALQAIFFAAGRRVAIINDVRLQEQDVVGAARVISIDRDRVLLLRGADPLELRLVTNDLKQPRSPSSSFPASESPPASISPPVAPPAVVPTPAIEAAAPNEQQQGSSP